METFEDLGAALGTVDVDADALIRRAVDAGRRHQRRRRVGAGVGVLAVGSLVTVTALHLGGSSDALGGGIATDPTASTASPGNGLPSPDVVDARLVERLPVAGDLVSADTGHGGVQVTRTLDPDGAGPGTVLLDVESGRAMAPGEIADTASKCLKLARLTGPESCKNVSGGWVFTLFEPPAPGNAAPRPLTWTATMVRSDGTTVSVDVTNYVDRRSPTRPTPVLDADQLGHLAIDPVWFEPAT